MNSRTPVILQGEAAECGLACLAMVAAGVGLDVNLRGLRVRYPASIRGYTLRRLLAIAAEIGLAARPMRTSLVALDRVRLPAILHWDMDHFVVLVARRRGQYLVHDPALGKRSFSRDELSPHFTGVVVDFSRPSQRVELKAPSIRISHLLPHLDGTRHLLLAVLSVTAIAQLLALAAPLYVQTVIDNVYSRGNTSLLLVVTMAFVGLTVIGVAIDGVRRWAVIQVGNAVGYSLSRYVLSHLYRLPALWFEKRHIGDVVSRISSVGAIREFITSSLITAMIDCVLVAIVATVLVAYSPLIAAVIIFSVLLYILISLILYPLLRRRFADFVVLSARQESFNVESIRAARAIRLNGLLNEREAHWSSIYVNAANAGLRMGTVTIGTAAARTLIFAIQLAVILYLGAYAVLRNDGLTIGMMFAILAYRNILTERGAAIVDRYFEFKMLDVHLDRISDIILGGDEKSAAAATSPPKQLKGDVKLEGVTFSYDSEAPPILNAVDLTISPGDYVAISGVSGAGKSTLVKLILGLIEPQSGTIRIDDVPVSSPAPDWLLSQISVVMQDDVLISGTVADNIAFFDPDLDMERVEQAARASHIAGHIESLPMRYMSIIGDIRAALSAGQRQRLLLARALYRNPQILILDEGTANLDHETEVSIAEVIATLDITRIIVAHRPELIRRAHRVLRLENGRLLEASFSDLSYV